NLHSLKEPPNGTLPGCRNSTLLCGGNLLLAVLKKNILGKMKAQFEKEQSRFGEFQRQEDAFRDWISRDGSTGYPAVAERYHLYISLACPWASRTLIARKLLGLEQIIGLTVVDPVRDERGWAFRDPSSHSYGRTSAHEPFPSTDPINGFHFLAEAYELTDPKFDGRVTVPVLWDKQRRRIVNNCENDICRMFNDAFRALAQNKEIAGPAVGGQPLQSQRDDERSQPQRTGWA